MKKNALLLFLSFIIALNTANAQLKTEGEDDGRIPIRSTILTDDITGYSLIYEPTIDDECLAVIEFPFYATNLENYLINEDKDPDKDIYYLPQGQPEMVAKYNLLDRSGTENLRSFKFLGTKTINGDREMHIYASYVRIEIYTYEICGLGASQASYDLSLWTPDIKNLDTQNLIPYSICEFIGEGQIFQSDAFNLLPNNCGQPDIHKENGAILVDCGLICPYEAPPIDRASKSSNDDLFNVLASPNPFTSFVNLKFRNSESNNINSIEIYNTIGEIIHQTNGLNFEGLEEYSLDLSHLTKGLYLLKIKGDKYDKTLKLLKQ